MPRPQIYQRFFQYQGLSFWKFRWPVSNFAVPSFALFRRPFFRSLPETRWKTLVVRSTLKASSNHGRAWYDALWELLLVMTMNVRYLSISLKPRRFPSNSIILSLLPLELSLDFALSQCPTVTVIAMHIQRTKIHMIMTSKKENQPSIKMKKRTGSKTTTNPSQIKPRHVLNLHNTDLVRRQHYPLQIRQRNPVLRGPKRLRFQSIVRLFTQWLPTTLPWTTRVTLSSPTGPQPM